MKRILFLCTGNSARSQLAEAIMRDMAGDEYMVMSAGMRLKGSTLGCMKCSII
ncbi:hypothetical protein [Photobacterium swingsii]|uniref:arsenate reductase/protein-tyrosine-phosphatase family protein n=1 Tax=Photobacterium swingsii TaxID=680026 RepID=UPI000A98DD00